MTAPFSHPAMSTEVRRQHAALRRERAFGIVSASLAAFIAIGLLALALFPTLDKAGDPADPATLTERTTP